MSYIKEDVQFLDIGNKLNPIGNEVIVDKTDAFISYLMLMLFTSFLSITYHLVSYIVYDIIYLRLLTYGNQMNQILANNKRVIERVNHKKKTS